MFKIIGKQILSLFCKFLLFLFDWKYPSDQLFDKISKIEKSVVIFSHTTYADFYIFTLYLLAFPDELKDVRILVKPQPFKYAGWILRKLGAIPATKFNEYGGGSVAKIIEEVKDQEKLIFLISPKGTIVKSEWRSGYLAIAKELKANFMVSGLDYEKKILKLSDSIEYTEGKEKEIEIYLKNQLKDIVPLFPEDEVVEIRRHNQSKRSIIEGRRLSIIVMSIIAIYMLIR